MTEPTGFDPALIEAYKKSLQGNTPAAAPAKQEPKPAAEQLVVHVIDQKSTVREAMPVLFATRDNEERAAQHAFDEDQRIKTRNAASYMNIALRTPPDEHASAKEKDTYDRDVNASRAEPYWNMVENLSTPKPLYQTKFSEMEMLLAQISVGPALGSPERALDYKQVFNSSSNGAYQINVPTDGDVLIKWNDDTQKYRVYVHPENMREIGKNGKNRPYAFDSAFVEMSREQLERKTTFAVLSEPGRASLGGQSVIHVRSTNYDRFKLHSVDSTEAKFTGGSGVIMNYTPPSPKLRDARTEDGFLIQPRTPQQFETGLRERISKIMGDAKNHSKPGAPQPTPDDIMRALRGR